ncbi:MAG TPA: TetR/AcrR family transcriptional regulator [Mariniphaga sp.]|nr:TetR/AcrR family transcriptional regulator [Mariniphaga sp.]
MKQKEKQTIVPKSEPKLKKTPSGPIREKTRTINKIISSVGKVLQKKGYSGLTIINIAAEAKVSPKLVYLYFGNIDNLIETFIKQRDFWNMAEKGVIEETLSDLDNVTKEDIVTLLQSQYNRLYKDKLFQKLIHWELGEHTPTLRKIADTREEIGEKLFNVIEDDFVKKNIDIRSVLALQIAGIYYLVLHANTNGSTFCGVDINDEKDKDRITDAIDYIIHLLYAQVGKGD